MIGIISVKIVNSWKTNPNNWIIKVKNFLASFGPSPSKWEIFGGNAFILKISHPEEGLLIAMILKAIFRQIEDLDVVVQIAIGTESTPGTTVRESKGEVYNFLDLNSEEKIPKKPSLKLLTNNKSLNKEINLLFDFALISMNQWSFAEAEMVELCLLFPEKSQQEFAEWLRINQSAVSQRRARAHLDLLLQLDEYFKNKIKEILNK
ncbi:MAG TPA: hypothetical protein PKX92_07955 [Edaphocola sp.]|nr:hypothetical protein [Edaphocola sp.]